MNAGLGKIFVVGVVGVAAAVGCYRKVYVYEYADGRRIESNFPLNENPKLEVFSLKPADADGNQFTGEWRGAHLESARDDRALMLNTVSDDGRR